jgi:two-component system OmpR family sensor kinase
MSRHQGPQHTPEPHQPEPDANAEAQADSNGPASLAGTRRPGLAPRLSLRWRLTLATFGLLAVLLAGLGLLVTLTEERTLLRDQARALHDEARLAVRQGGGFRGPPEVTSFHLLISQTGPPPSVGDGSAGVKAFAALLVTRLSGPETAVSVVTISGQMIYGMPTDAPQFVSLIQPDSGMIQDVLSGPLDTGNYHLAIDGSGRRQLVVLLPIVEDNHTVALLELSKPTTQIDSSVANIRLLLFLGIGGCLLVAALLARPLIGAALRPLVAMERASQRIADGALSLRLEEPPASDEIGNLARSFNLMVARLDAAFTRQRRFVADVSHELRTPLTALAGGIEMLLLGADKQDPADPEASRRLLRGLYGETERMRRLVEDLLTLARLDEGRAQLRLEPMDVGALLGAVCEQAPHLARGQEIICEVAPGLPSIRADADRLRQVLLNLVENAVKFTPAPGQIRLAARPSTDDPSGAILIEVRDSGIGIPPEDLAHVFDRFYRVDSSRARPPAQPGGSGLGLAISKSLVEAQGGSIVISSKPDAGTLVALRFPALPPERLRTTGSRLALGRGRRATTTPAQTGANEPTSV